MKGFVVRYGTKCVVLNTNDMETYVNKIVNERFNNGYKIKFVFPELEGLKHPENIVPLIKSALCMCSFPSVRLLLENYPYSIDVIVYPIFNHKL